MIKDFIGRILSSVPSSQGARAPLEIQSLRICDAGDYRLAQLDLGIDFMDNRRRNDLEEELTARFREAPAGYKILARLRLKAGRSVRTPSR